MTAAASVYFVRGLTAVRPCSFGPPRDRSLDLLPVRGSTRTTQRQLEPGRAVVPLRLEQVEVDPDVVTPPGVAHLTDPLTHRQHQPAVERPYLLDELVPLQLAPAVRRGPCRFAVEESTSVVPLDDRLRAMAPDPDPGT